MTGPHICLWCHQPIVGTPCWWDERPQCPDEDACQRRALGEDTE